MTTATIDLTNLLTDEQYESVFGISSRYEQDLIAAIVRAEGGDVYKGVEDTYFPDPVFMTESEILDHAKFMHTEASRYTDETTPLHEVESEVKSATKMVDPDIVEIIWSRCLDLGKQNAAIVSQ